MSPHMETLVVSFVFPPSPGSQTQGPAMLSRGCAALLQSQGLVVVVIVETGFLCPPRLSWNSLCSVVIVETGFLCPSRLSWNSLYFLSTHNGNDF